MASAAAIDSEVYLNTKFFYLLELKGKRNVLEWCMNNGLIAKSCRCPKCGGDMHLDERAEVSDAYDWACSKDSTRRSCRSESWFDNSKMSLAMALQFTVSNSLYYRDAGLNPGSSNSLSPENHANGGCMVMGQCHGCQRTDCS